MLEILPEYLRDLTLCMCEPHTTNTNNECLKCSDAITASPMSLDLGNGVGMVPGGPGLKITCPLKKGAEASRRVEMMLDSMLLGSNCDIYSYDSQSHMC